MSFKSITSLRRAASVLSLAVLLLVVVAANGYPANQGEQAAAYQLPAVEELNQEEASPLLGSPVAAEGHQRFKRATCDLTSGTGLASSLCAAHCIAKGKSGGYCNNKLVCVCR